MFGIIYCFITLYLIGLFTTYIKEYFEEKDLYKSELEQNSKTAFLTGSRKLASFTIKETKPLIVSQVFMISMLRLPFIKLRHIFNENFHEKSSLIKKAVRFANLKLRKLADNAEYVVNYKVKFNWITPYKFEVLLTGTAVYLYEDTLGLYNITSRNNPIKPNFIDHLYKVVITLVVGFFVFVGLNLLNSKVNSFLIKHLPISDEKIIWSYLKDDALKDHKFTQEYIDAEHKVNELIGRIIRHNVTEYKNITAYVIDDKNPDMLIYPSGNIIISSGLLNKVKNENELLYLLAHEIGHITHRQHLKAFKDNIINYYILLKVFGYSGLMDIIVSPPAALDNNYYTDAEEIVADKFALSAVNMEYGNFAGIANIESDLAASAGEFSVFNWRHPNSEAKSKQHSEVINSIQNNGNVAPVPLHFALDIAAEIGISTPIANLTPKTTASQALNNEFAAIFNEYKSGLTTLVNGYNSYFANAMQVFNISSEDGVQELNKKYEFANSVANYINEVQNSFSAQMSYFDQKFDTYFSKIKDEDTRRLQKLAWDKEKEAVTRLMNFNLNRDAEIIDIEKIILEFITKRYGTYTVNKYGVRFSSTLSQQSYDQLINQLNALRASKYEGN